MVTLEQRLERIDALRAKGYNCAQCVMLVFSDLFPNLSESDLAAFSSAYGGGVAGTGHICGAASTMGAVVGMLNYKAPADKRLVYGKTADLISRFASLQNGKTDCRDLRVPGAKPCTQLIRESVTILHNYLNAPDAQ